MKKYMTIAALLAAGTAFANAETFSWTFVNWTKDTAQNTEFSDKLTSETATDWTVSANYTITTASGSPSYTTISDGAFAPATNIGNGGAWEVTLKFSNNSDVDYTFNGLSLDFITYNVSGETQTVARSADVVVTGADNVTLASEAALSVTGAATWTKSTSQWTIGAGQSGSIKVAVSQDTTNTLGSFWGLKTVSLSTIPEPSAFGLLAGLGALALVASRRRRNRR